MFAVAARSFARRSVGAFGATAGAASLLYAQQRPQQLYCEQNKPKGIAMEIGKKFIQLYLAEHADANGEVDLSKSLTLAQATHLFTASGAKEKEAARIFEDMDTDNSGSVDYVEVCAYFCDRGIGSLKEKAEFFFHACDIDGSGTIEACELKTVIHHMMLLKRDSDGRDSFMTMDKVLYLDIPEKYIYHFQANELVADILRAAPTKGEVTEKAFQQWMQRGGKEVKQLKALFGIESHKDLKANV
jgi:Ca2+-binding EF-hand superfamily protein